jgi:hypothetical protein
VKKSLSAGIELSVILRSLLFFLVLCCCLFSARICWSAERSISSGEYIDSKGAPHSWHVNAQHTLVWGGRPWMPAGGIFQSRYLTGPQTDSNWAADIADLTALKQHGIRSLILVTSSELDPLTDIPPANLQKVLNYLDDQGFQYGLALSSFPRNPVEANIVNPALYRIESPSPGSVSTFGGLGGLVGATYYLVSMADGSVIMSGSATVVDAQTASVTIPSGQGGAGTVLLLYPRRLFLPDSIEGKHLPDIWGQADGYRDDLLLYFSNIKFGRGLRFFLDPIVDGLGYYGDADAGAIPDGDGYRLQFQIWLETHYGKSLARLNESWGVKNQDIFDFAAASRSTPLWYQSKGIQLLTDPVSNKSFEVTAAQSGYWADVRQFRLDSAKSVMNGIALALKRGVADVPVVYRWTRPSKVYVDSVTTEGYDGLLVSSTEHGNALTSTAAGWALAAEEQSARSEWLVGDISPLTGGTGAGYVAKTALVQDGQALQSIGVKGYFVDSFRKLPDSDNASSELLNAPLEQLDWIGSDQATFDADARDQADFLPNLLFYPTNLGLATTTIQQFGDGTWWLPSYFAGEEVDVGRGYCCYSLDQPQIGNALVLWSPDGTISSAQFQLPKTTYIRAHSPAGKVVTLQLKKSIYTCPVSKTPVVLEGVTTLPLVANASVLELAEAMRLIQAGKDQGMPMDVYVQRLYYIQNEVLGGGDKTASAEAFPMLKSFNDQLQADLSPYAWVEGEAATTQSFGTVVTSPTAAGGAFLWQDTASAPQLSAAPYEATYTLNVGTPGEYTVWASIAPGPPGTGATSSLSYSLDDGTSYDASQPEPSGEQYGDVLDAASTVRSGGFCWYRLGTLTLTPGSHLLNFIITGPAPATGRYTMGIDAICLAHGDFVPDGAARPVVK